MYQTFKVCTSNSFSIDPFVHFFFKRNSLHTYIVMSEEITAAKRPRLDTNVEDTEHSFVGVDMNSWEITPILPDTLNESIPRCSIYVAVINDMKCVSKVMNELCQVMPLRTLNHLKRVNKSKVILCSVDDVRQFFQQNLEKESIQELLFNLFEKHHVPTEDELNQFPEDIVISFVKFYLQNIQLSADIVGKLGEKIEMLDVAARPPILGWQYADAVKDWPCKFHPNKHLEQLYAGKSFSTDEIAFHRTIIAVCGFLRTELKKETCGIAVDPRTKSIVAVGFDAFDLHPLMHCSMVLIDGVARSQNGGAWNDFLVPNQSHCDESHEYTMSGVSPDIRQLVSSKFKTINFGAECVKLATKNRENLSKIETNADNLSKYGPYLCTGYDVYLWREPCVMCSMALTHSRSRTIFFHEKQPNGALCSLTKLQSFKALNHHFQVFNILKN